MKLNRETVHSLRQSAGMTMADIARMYGVTRQYVFNLYTGYDITYRKTDRYKMYKRHRGHSLDTNLTKPCDFCVNENNVKRVVDQVY